MDKNVENLELQEIAEIPVTEDRKQLFAISVDNKGEAKAYPLENIPTKDEVDMVMKDKASAKDMSNAQKDISTLNSTKANQTALIVVQDEVDSSKKELIRLESSKVDKKDFNNSQVAIKRYKDAVTNIGDLPTTGNQEADGRLVRNDQDENGSSYIWVWDGREWSRTPYTKLPSNIVTTNDIATQFLLPNNFTQGEVKCASAIKAIEVFGIRDIIKINIFINSALYPYRMALYNETKNESSDWFFNGKNELVKNLWGGKIRIVADWLILGDNYINTSPEATRFILSEKCYQISPSFTDMAETFTGAKTFERSPTIPMAVSANNPITYAQFADLVVEPIDFTIAELACISAIKHFSVEGSTDMFKIGILINNAEFKTRLWLYNTTRNRVEKLEFKGNSSTTYTTAEGAKINANVNWLQLGNNGINVTEANARLVISARCYISSISALLLPQGDVAAFCGDSIMAQMSGYGNDQGLDVRGFPRLQKQLAFKEVINCAIGGGTWQDRTVITDKPTESTAETTGGISNQILKLKRLVSEGRPTPNLIVIAAGTNSSGGRGDYDTIMAMTYDELKADLETRRTFYGGMRYSIELAMREFPNAQIMLFAPIQSTDHPNRTFELLVVNAYSIEKMANRYAIPFVNSLFESGINDLVNSDKYLSDKVHLTELGKDKYTAFIASKINHYYTKMQ